MAARERETGWRHGDAGHTQAETGELSGEQSRATPHAPRRIKHTHGFTSTPRTQQGRRRFPGSTESTPAMSRAAAEQPWRRTDDLGNGRERGGHSKVQGLTQDACTSLAMKGEAITGRNRRRSASGSEEGNGTAMAKEGLPPRFLARGQRERPGGASTANESSRRAPLQRQSHITSILGFRVGAK